MDMVKITALRFIGLFVFNKIIFINIKLMQIHFIYEAKHESININTISLCNY